MTASSGGFSSVPLIRSKLQIFSFVMLLSVLSCAAQQVQTESAQTHNPPSDETPVTIPAGTHLALSLTHPVDSRATHRGDEIFAQTTSPVIVSNQVVIPAGAFVQGKVDKLSRRGSRASC
jgi:hypothetical protein